MDDDVKKRYILFGIQAVFALYFLVFGLSDLYDLIPYIPAYSSIVMTLYIVINAMVLFPVLWMTGLLLKSRDITRVNVRCWEYVNWVLMSISERYVWTINTITYSGIFYVLFVILLFGLLAVLPLEAHEGLFSLSGFIIGFIFLPFFGLLGIVLGIIALIVFLRDTINLFKGEPVQKTRFGIYPLFFIIPALVLVVVSLTKDFWYEPVKHLFHAF